jgi:hypothetical protein
MRKHIRLPLLIGASVLAVGLVGCQRTEGPAERAGKQVDKSAERVSQQVEKAADKVKDKVDDAKK